MPQSAWCCPHLTSLLLSGIEAICAPAGSPHFSGLRQLHVVDSAFDSGEFPKQLCTALRQLSSLVVTQECFSYTPPGLTSLPPEFSQLRCARELQCWELPDLIAIAVCSCRCAILPCAQTIRRPHCRLPPCPPLQRAAAARHRTSCHEATIPGSHPPAAGPHRPAPGRLPAGVPASGVLPVQPEEVCV